MLFDIIITKEDMENPNGTVIFQKDALLQFLEDIKTLDYLKND